MIIALCGMLIVPFSFFQSLGLGAILVVLVALAATFTFLPANLAVHRDRLNRLPVPFFGRKETQLSRSSGGSGQGFWELVTRVVMRYPVISIIAVGAPMIAVTLFYFQWPGINTGLNGVDVFPEGAQTKDAFFVIEEEFSFGLVYPTDIVIDGDIDSPGVQEGIGKLQASLAAHPGVQVFPIPDVNDSRDLANLTVFIPGESRSRDTVDVVSTIRDRYVPNAFDGVDAEVLAGGVTAEAVDTFSIVRVYTPNVFAFVLGCSFLILMLVFRSIVIPIKAVIMNLLSVGTAYGLIVLVFQKGVAADLLGFQQAEVIDVWIPLFLFSILFGLSMDYHVFLLSRIRERYDQTGDNAEALSYRLRSTAGSITGEDPPPTATKLPTNTPTPTSAPMPTEVAPEEKVLTIRYWQAPSLPSPYLADGYKDRDAAAVTLEPLASYDPEGGLTPRLAVDIPTVENEGVAQDLTSIRWKLREGLKWSDGSDLTAHDVVGIARMRRPDAPARTPFRESPPFKRWTT